MTADNWKELKFQGKTLSGTITPVTKVLDKGLGALDTVVTALSHFLQLLQLFISSFSSFATVLQTFVQFSQRKINEWTRDLADFGIYMNVIVPPAFVSSLANNENFLRLATGGFNGFIQRLKVAMHNTADKNCPRFSEQAKVGGMIILVDSETLYDFYRGADFLKGTFNLVDLIPVNTKFAPPRNIRGSSGYFEQPDGSKKLGIQLQWDAPSVTGLTGTNTFCISRSQISGGVGVEKTIIPTQMFGPKGQEEEGLLAAMKMRFFSDARQWPKKYVYIYNDSDFNGEVPKIVQANPITGGGNFIDYDIHPEEARQYYYVIQSGSAGGSFLGDYSPECMIPTFPKNCITPEMAAAVEHGNGEMEFLSVGTGALGQWSAIKTKALLPFLPAIIDLLNGLINSLVGGLKTNTKSFSDFLKGIQAKFKKYRDYLDAMTTMLQSLENIFSGAPSVAILNIPVAPGGVRGFLSRVILATPPAGGFTGVEGLTMGIVLLYGEGFQVDPLGHETADSSAQIKAISTTFNLMIKLFS